MERDFLLMELRDTASYCETSQGLHLHKMSHNEHLVNLHVLYRKAYTNKHCFINSTI